MEKKDNMILGIDFSDIEKRALIKAARMMVLADGRVEVSELLAIANESSKIFRGIDDFKYALLESETLDKKAMNYVLSKMNDKKKKYVLSLLAAIMEIDGDRDKKELLLWEKMRDTMKIQGFTINQALDFWRENKTGGNGK